MTHCVTWHPPGLTCFVCYSLASWLLTYTYVCHVPCIIYTCAMCHVPCAMCHVPCVMCHVPCVTCRVPCLQVAYMCMQSLVLALLLTLWLRLTSFQPRFAAIQRTLQMVSPDLVHEGLVLALLLLMYCGVVVLMWGPYVDQLASWSTAVPIMAGYLLTGQAPALATVRGIPVL